mgnify:CR=1 FL=1
MREATPGQRTALQLASRKLRDSRIAWRQFTAFEIVGGFVALVFSLLVLPFGGTVRAGVGGYLVFALVGALLAVIFGGLAVAAAIATGSWAVCA